MGYFSTYGTIEDCIIMVDRDHSKYLTFSQLFDTFIALEPRGFGFVTFTDVDSVDKVLAHEDHFIDGKQVECKKAVPKDPPPNAAIGGTAKRSSSANNQQLQLKEKPQQNLQQLTEKGSSQEPTQSVGGKSTVADEFVKEEMHYEVQAKSKNDLANQRAVSLTISGQ